MADNFCHFQAYDTTNETAVTIVEVPLRLPKVAGAAQREALNAGFVDQATVLAKFKHNSVVAVREFFIEAGRYYLVTDPIEGSDLASVLADRSAPFPVTEVTGWADTLLDALNGLHNFRPPMVYRNIRPENVVLRADGSVTFGASGLINCGTQNQAQSGSNGAGPDLTLVYAPLEQIWSGLDAASQKVIVSKYDEASEKILKKELDARSDIYSLGATLYHLITGREPVDALERSIEMIEGNSDPLQSPHNIDSAIPPEVSDVIMKAMEIKREYRFDSAAIMRQVLRTALVRVKEREAEEALQPNKSVANNPVAERAKPNNGSSLHAADRHGAKQVAREADKKQPGDEKHAAETVTKPRETERFSLSDIEDDLLGLMSPSVHTSAAPSVHTSAAPQAPQKAAPSTSDTPHGREPGAADQVAAPIQSDISAVFDKEHREPATESSSDHSLHTSKASDVDSQSEKIVSERAHDSVEKIENGKTPDEVPAVTEPAFSARPTSAERPVVSEELFSTENAGRGIKLPAIAAAVAVICIAVVGGWFLLSSKTPAPVSAAPETPAASQPASPETPVRTAYQPTEPAAAETSTSPTAETPGASDQETNPEPQKSTAAPTKPKKTTPVPARAPAQKKPVTVDDLINDN